MCLAQPFESNYRYEARENISRGAADVTTTADSATIAAQERAQSLVDPTQTVSDQAAHAVPQRHRAPSRVARFPER